MRKRRLFGALIFVIPAVLAVATIAVADDGGRRQFRSETLSGYNEAGPGPGAISTTGIGSFVIELERDTPLRFTYTLTYSGLEGIAPAVTGGIVTQAHIHFGKRGVGGGVIAFLCSNIAGAPAAPASTPPVCPPSGTVTGTIAANDIIGPAGQGIEAASFDEALRALRAGAVYANVHTTRWGSGEIRGQVNERGQGDRDRDEDDD